MNSRSRVSFSLSFAVVGGLLLSGCVFLPTQPSPSHPSTGTLPFEPTFAIEWEAEDPTVFLRQGVVYLTRGFGDDKELVALQPEVPEQHVPEEPLTPMAYEELWSISIGEAEFAVADDLYERPRIAVVRGDEAYLLDTSTGEELQVFELPAEAVSIDVQTFDSFFIGLSGGDTEQLVLTSTGDLLMLEEWVFGFPSDVNNYGSLHDWVLPVGSDRKGMLHIRGDDFYWRFDGTDPDFAAALGLGDEYALVDGLQGFGDVLLQYARLGVDVASGTYTQSDVVVARLKDGELLEVHAGSVLCGQGICSGEFSVVDGVVQPGAAVVRSIPDRDEPEVTDVELVDIREFPRFFSGELPGGEYEVIGLGTNWPWAGERTPTHVGHDDTDPLRIGGDAGVPCQRVDGRTGGAACVATGEPMDDESVPLSLVARFGVTESLGSYRLNVLLTDQHILLAPQMVIE